ncbi:AAA family ATPase [Pseudomonas putida]|uniref:UvrD-helicase domain-containing protein n=1 Tax=Pseudomonas putida TaxID=303 RepID=UPI002270A544|nr:UvrD-helicase domain-containing protein [Pseudomonas putida]WAB99739.1 AAA family ATPase [Pseudomonas putida]
MSEELALKLNACTNKGYVIAPAGYGKTHLIALAVRASSGRQLVLTHTFAGVNSIKAKMAALGVPATMYQVDTIASWSLRLCLAYPKTSGWITDAPTDEQWNQLYDCCSGLLAKSFIRKTMSSTYAGLYVDEYQDCSELQHSLVCAVADVLPCRVLGDPLQAIFDFDDAKPVDWAASVYPAFECLGELNIPWRWAENPVLGAWLKDVRRRIQSGQQIDLFANRPPCVVRHRTDPQNLESKQYFTLLEMLAHGDRVIALHGGAQQLKNKTHRLACRMAGRFSSIEEIEGRELHAFLKKVGSAKNHQKAFLLAVEFAKKCFTGVSNVLTAGTKRGEATALRKTTKYPAILHAANAYIENPSSAHLLKFFEELQSNSRTGAYRRDLLNRLIQVLKMHRENTELTLTEVGKAYQRDMRHMGRPTRHKKLIGTTLLVKGLEFDHAVILDADSLDAKDLYVAMTRGTKTLTIIGDSRYVPIR